MPEKIEAQKRAQKKYIEQFVEIKVRVTPDRRTAIQAHAKSTKESTTAFINRAIDEMMERDEKETSTQETKENEQSSIK